MKRIDQEHEVLSRRAFLRGQLPSTQARLAASWQSLEGFPGQSHDVLWAGWADKEGTFITGDDGLILHHDGIIWTSQHVPVPLPIHALWGNSRHDLWAVGWMGLVLHHDGSNWSQVRGCIQDKEGKYASCDENAPLFAISGRADGLAWAVGDHGTVLHYDGSHWQREQAGTRLHLRAVCCLADGRVIAAGGDGCILIRDLNGSWVRLEHPYRSNFTTALALEDGSVLLAGGRYFVDENGFRGEVFLLSEQGVEQLFSESKFTRFRALTQHGSTVLAVGDGGQIHRFEDGQINRLVTETQHDLLGIIPLPNNAVLAIGDFGTALHCQDPGQSTVAKPLASVSQDTLWEPMKSGTDRQLWGLWAHPVTQQLYACGEEGVVLVHDRGQWERLPPWLI